MMNECGRDGAPPRMAGRRDAGMGDAAGGRGGAGGAGARLSLRGEPAGAAAQPGRAAGLRIGDAGRDRAGGVLLGRHGAAVARAVSRGRAGGVAAGAAGVARRPGGLELAAGAGRGGAAGGGGLGGGAAWTGPLRAAYLAERTGVAVGERTVRRGLDLLGYVCRRPTWTVRHKAEAEPDYPPKAAGSRRS